MLKSLLVFLYNANIMRRNDLKVGWSEIDSSSERTAGAVAVDLLPW